MIFTIAFWVKTTQTGGTPEWYNGEGLVDGDSPGVANDFGTALGGGKFGFGVGNPDTTIFSTASIKDGLWHYCVATRQLATGTMNAYVDGILQASAAVNEKLVECLREFVVRGDCLGGGYFNGSLDEIRIFSRALGSNEVGGLYDSYVAPPATAPANLTATAGSSQVQLSWWAASAGTSYNVKRSLISGGPYAVITNVSTTSYTDTNIVNNRTYYYVVSAVNSIGESANSARPAPALGTGRLAQGRCHHRPDQRGGAFHVE